jgi:hypothetical protein
MHFKQPRFTIQHLMKTNEREIIGRKDRIDIPEFELFDLAAKIDTGAYGCALHCHHIRLAVDKGTPVLTFNILDPNHKNYEGTTYQTTDFRRKIVKSSSGFSEERFVIHTEVLLFNQCYKVSFSLTDRSNMKHPVLIGRKLLSRNFIVDVRKKDLSYKLKKQNAKLP